MIAAWWLAFLVGANAPLPAPAAMQACAQPEVTVMAPEGTYASVGLREFEGRVFIYVPTINAQGNRIAPFDVWFVEGVYGRPFPQPSGPLNENAFSGLRANANIRATAVRVGGAVDTARVTIARQVLAMDVRVSAGNPDELTMRICRSR